ncbi:hypothetical protein [Streptomyces chartreusis]|uniref:hypothetical protein n=1 Tax=Streptomyces chartreusis TaxID=1969 RepID=UPI0036395403
MRRHLEAGARAAVTDRTLRAWLEGTRAPSQRNLARIEQDCRTVRRHSVARYLLAASTVKAAASGFHPLNQSQVDRPRQQVLPYRSLNVRHRDWISRRGPTTTMRL